MRNPFWRSVCIVVLLAMLSSSVHASRQTLAAQSETRPVRQQPGMRVVEASYAGVSQPLRSLAPNSPSNKPPSAARQLQERLVLPKTQAAAQGGFDASIVQDSPIGLSMPAPLANFEGVNNLNAVLPPDTQGDIGYDLASGKKYYVQWVNLSFQIWDVTNPAAPSSVYGPAAGNSLWSGTGTLCESHNDGDPITLFDHLANRWLMSQFALSFPNDFHQCIAISATADPTGIWYLYDFQTSTTMMNDYPKFGVWPDGYYMTVNEFDGIFPNPFVGAGVAVFERSAMLSGQLSARMVYIDLGAVTLNYGGILPSDLDGPPPAEGAPNYFMEWDDSTWLGDQHDTLRIWEFHVDWSNPANTTFGANANFDPDYTVSTANVDPNMCGVSSNVCIPQPDTSVKLDPISDRLMYRLQFRNFGSYQTLVSNHTVDSNGSDVAGIHWFELRDTGTGWTLHQEGLYAPADSNQRWMGSAAMDGAGDIALGYSVSSGSIYPSVRYTGRLAADPTGQLPQGESELIAGSGSQTSSFHRWGDYSMLGVDPVDDCTFWYTQEYVETTSEAGWQTRIGSLRFPSCTDMPTGTLSGTITDGVNPISGAAISITGGYSTVADAAGAYTIVLPADSYDVTASKYGFLPFTASGVSITSGGNTLQNFVLGAAPARLVSGVVSDAATGWPLYARINVSGYPASPIFTDPVTGAYSLELVESAYVFTVSAMSGGYAQADVNIVVAGDTTQDITLAADASICSAPGYVLSGFYENFDAWPLAGWTIKDNISGGGLTWNRSLFYGDGNYTGGGRVAADVNSDANKNVKYDTELITPLITSAALSNLTLVYKANFQKYALGSEALDLDISNDTGATWTNLRHWVESHGSWYGVSGETVSVDLTPYAGPSFKLRWHYYTPSTSPWDYYAQIDDVSLGLSCNPLPSGGLVSGVVYDAHHGAAIPNPRLQNAALDPALIIDNSDDPGQDHPFYTIGAPAGPASLTASAWHYASSTATPVAVAGGAVRQDFHLAAGELSANPTSLAFSLGTWAPTGSRSLGLNNSGSASAQFEIFALPGLWSGYSPTGPFAVHTRHVGPKNINDLDASKLRVDLTPQGIAALDAGSISASWNTGLVYSWGIGFNTDANDLWVGDIAVAGGANKDYRFLTGGANTGDTIDASPWVSAFAADMAYNPFTRKFWQVNVGGDDCIYELDPAAKISTGNKICPAFGVSERGLAFDPLSNTYYAGSWVDGVINHFAPDGALLDSISANLDVSGLAFNPGTGHLFVMTNHAQAAGVYDVYVLDTRHAYNNLGGFNLTLGSASAFADYDQAGLEIDCAGNLWAVDQGKQKVYVSVSGETGVCNWRSGWLSAAPSTGSAPAGGSSVRTIKVNAAGMAGGAYQAYLRVVSDTPYGDEIVPVTLNVTEAKHIYLPLVRR